MPTGFSYSPVSDRIEAYFKGIFGSAAVADNFIRTQDGFEDFSISSTEMNTLNATPKTIISAPGAGKFLLATQAFTFIDVGSVDFELGSGTLDYNYTDGSGDPVVTVVPNTIVEASADAYYRSIALAVAPVVNAPIVAHTTADVTAGNGTVYGRIYYRVLTVSELSTTRSA